MAESSTNTFSQISSLFKGLSPARKLTFFLVIGVSIAGCAFLMSWAGKSNFQRLYADLNPDDAGVIISRLKAARVPFRISPVGDTILVPEEKVAEMRMEFAAQGLPRGSGVGFEVFDSAKLGMTEFVQNVNYQRALQGELCRTIDQFEEVERSRVHIVMQNRSVFAEEEEPATASVVLKLRPGRYLRQSQVQGIIHLVSSSVSGLDPEHITIVDSYGKLLSAPRSSASRAEIDIDQLALQEKREKNLESRIKAMLDQALGQGKAVIQISCDMDFTRQEKTEEMYLPENRVVRSEQNFSSASKGTSDIPAGIPGMASNTGAAPAANRTASAPVGFSKNDKTVNYEIGKVTSHKVMPVGQVTRISAAVIVDGTYQKNTGKDGAVDWTYVPRSRQEMDNLENIVKRAVNFDADRGDEIKVVNIPFEKEPLDTTFEAEAPTWIDKLKPYGGIVKYALAALFVLMAFIFVVRPLVRWLTTAAAGDYELLSQLPKTVGELESEMGTSGALPYRQKVSRMIDGDSEKGLTMMRDWLKEKP